jgi:hypothetical protein
MIFDWSTRTAPIGGSRRRPSSDDLSTADTANLFDARPRLSTRFYAGRSRGELRSHTCWLGSAAALE